MNVRNNYASFPSLTDSLVFSLQISKFSSLAGYRVGVISADTSSPTTTPPDFYTFRSKSESEISKILLSVLTSSPILLLSLLYLAS